MGFEFEDEIKLRLKEFLENQDQHYGDYFRKFKAEIKDYGKKISLNKEYFNSEIFDIIGQIVDYPPIGDKSSLLNLCNQLLGILGESSNTQQMIKDFEKERTVFVVHGRNNEARAALFTFLRSIDIHPLEWSEIVNMTGKTNPYIGDVLKTAFANVQAIIILFTGDDEVKLRDKFIRDRDPYYEKELTPQARPNVLFEAGWAMGIFPKRTIIIELGELKPFSDIGGRHVIRLNSSPEKRKELIDRLRTAGCVLKDIGNDWLSAGNFNKSIV